MIYSGSHTDLGVCSYFSHAIPNKYVANIFANHAELLSKFGLIYLLMVLGNGNCKSTHLERVERGP